ncbi:MAG: ParB/RepB/Spo0J family partition protein [Oscillospiraceae bacterium]
MGKLKLGKGMDALFYDNEDTRRNAGSTLRLSQIEPNKAQPRTDFDDEAILSLAESIRIHGVLQPILVRPIADGYYQIVAGERRWRASRMAGLSEVPVLIKELDDKTAMQIALIENLQREDLNPIEEALGYQNLMEEFGMTQAQVAEAIGKSRPTVANALRLLTLDETTKEHLRRGNMTTGHAKVIAGIADEETRKRVAMRVVMEDLSVRQTEAVVYKELKGEAPDAETPSRQPKSSVSIFKEVELSLNDILGKRIRVHGKPDGSSVLQISLHDVAELKAIAKILAEAEIDVAYPESR